MNFKSTSNNFRCFLIAGHDKRQRSAGHSSVSDLINKKLINFRNRPDIHYPVTIAPEVRLQIESRKPVILCPIDFSEDSKDVLKWAANFCRRVGCSLTILYTYRLTRHLETDAVGWKRKIENEATEKFSALEEECLKSLPVEYVFKAEVGFTINRVEDFIRKNNIRFLIISKNVLADNETCEALMKRIAVPIIILP